MSVTVRILGRGGFFGTHCICVRQKLTLTFGEYVISSRCICMPAVPCTAYYVFVFSLPIVVFGTSRIHSLAVFGWHLVEGLV